MGEREGQAAVAVRDRGLSRGGCHTTPPFTQEGAPIACEHLSPDYPGWLAKVRCTCPRLVASQLLRSATGQWAGTTSIVPRKYNRPDPPSPPPFFIPPRHAPSSSMLQQESVASIQMALDAGLPLEV